MLKGTVTLQIGNEIVYESNQINNQLKSYLANRLISDTQAGINNFFAESVEVDAANEDKDGIILVTAGLPITGITEYISSSDDLSQTWRAFFSPIGQIEVQEVQLGHSLKPSTNTAVEWFNTTYARKIYTTPLIVFANQPVAVTWNITIDRQ